MQTFMFILFLLAVALVPFWFCSVTSTLAIYIMQGMAAIHDEHARRIPGFTLTPQCIVGAILFGYIAFYLFNPF